MTSRIDFTSIPIVWSARIADSRPAPGPLTFTSTLRMPNAFAALPAEMAACVMAIREGIIPPTINLDNPDEQCDLDYVPHKAREKKVRVALNNSFGFGGHNATLVAREFIG